MDIWGGDPWTTEPEETEDIPSEQRPEVVQSTGFLSGFEDEAGWGNFEDGDGWGKEGIEEPVKQKDVERHSFAPAIVSPGWESVQSTSTPASGSAQSPQELKTPALMPMETHSSSLEQNEEVVPTSQKSTASDRTARPELEMLETAEHAATADIDSPPSPRLSISDEEKGLRPSLSSSDSSNEESRTPDSLRTSIDESYHKSDHLEKRRSNIEPVILPSQEDEVDLKQDDEFGDFEQEVQNSVVATKAQDPLDNVDEEDASDHGDELEKTHQSSSTSRMGHPKFQYDVSLVYKMFGKPTVSTKTPGTSTDIINDSSTRKSWYRVTRQETLREFNEGSSADNYVRIAWPRSNIRKETLKVVSRWASEDKVSGSVMFGGALPAASTFGWDKSSKTSPLQRRRSSGAEKEVKEAKVDVDAKPLNKRTGSRLQSTPTVTSPVASTPVAQFSWSSSVQPAEPTKTESSSTADQLDALFGATIPQSAAKPPDPAPLTTRRGSRSASMSSKSGSVPITASHRRSVTAVRPGVETVTPGFKSYVPPVISEEYSSTQLATPQSETMKVVDQHQFPTLDSSISLKLDTTVHTPKSEPEDADDDFGDWGEVLNSPSPPSTPMASASNAVLNDSVTLSKFVSPPTDSRKAKKPVPLVSPVQSSVAIPAGPLSPARKAAFEAARVTRSLSSQQRSDSLLDDEMQPKPSPHAKERLSSHVVSNPLIFSPVIEAPEHAVVVAQGSVPSIEPPQEAGLRSSEIEQPPKHNALITSDFSVFDTPPHFAQSSSDETPSSHLDISTTTEPPPRTTISPTNEENETVRRIIREFPDLSYMLR